jgi:hypothetical protein
VDEPQVRRVESDSISDPTWKITAARVPCYSRRDEPSAADLPADVRTRLRAWLDTADMRPS